MFSTTSQVFNSGRGTAQEFIQERKYLKNVTPKTIAWYEHSFHQFRNCTTEQEYKQRIMELRERGVSAISVNTWVRCINAFLKWRQAGFKLPKLREEQKILSTLTENDILKILRAVPIKSLNLRRAHLIALTILDTGLRASEVLGLTKENVDYESLVLKVFGKGSKYRLVPFSFELRKKLFLFTRVKSETRFIFGTKNNTKVSVRNLERDFQVLGKKLGITGVRFSPHTMRHSFAVCYLRAGGNVEFLRRILGHSSILTTQRYLRSLGVEDLGKVHNQLSPLAKR